VTRWKRTALWIVVGLGLSWVASDLLLSLLMGHRLYSVSGTALAKAESLRATALPAIVCVGNGGPLERSAVYALPLGTERDGAEVQTICRQPVTDLRFRFATSVYANWKPRNTHAYVWIEHHGELAEVCSAASSEILNVAIETLAGYDERAKRPCRSPKPDSVLGYAIAFHDFWSKNEQHANLELIPRGYPSSRATAH